jgi:hypothetical protein
MKIKLFYLLLPFINCTKNIKNINLPCCKNCVHYEPCFVDRRFISSLGKCTYFGEKDIITDTINYDYVSSCRNNENKCGENGKYFIEEKNIKLKILYHNIITTMPYFILFSVPIMYILKLSIIP